MPLAGVRQHVVRIRDLFELCFGLALCFVGVILLGQLVVGYLDLLLTCSLLHSKRLIVVLLGVKVLGKGEHSDWNLDCEVGPTRC